MLVTQVEGTIVTAVTIVTETWSCDFGVEATQISGMRPPFVTRHTVHTPGDSGSGGHGAANASASVTVEEWGTVREFSIRCPW